MTPPSLKLGAWLQVDGSPGGNELHLPTSHLVTHGVVVGMIGSGKTGLITVLVEEAIGSVESEALLARRFSDGTLLAPSLRTRGRTPERPLEPGKCKILS